MKLYFFKIEFQNRDILLDSFKTGTFCYLFWTKVTNAHFGLRSNNIFMYLLCTTYPTNTLIITLGRERIMHEYRLRDWDKFNIMIKKFPSLPLLISLLWHSSSIVHWHARALCWVRTSSVEFLWWVRQIGGVVCE